LNAKTHKSQEVTPRHQSFRKQSPQHPIPLVLPPPSDRPVYFKGLEVKLRPLHNIPLIKRSKNRSTPRLNLVHIVQSINVRLTGKEERLLSLALLDRVLVVQVVGVLWCAAHVAALMVVVAVACAGSVVLVVAWSAAGVVLSAVRGRSVLTSEEAALAWASALSARWHLAAVTALVVVVAVARACGTTEVVFVSGSTAWSAAGVVVVAAVRGPVLAGDEVCVDCLARGEFRLPLWLGLAAVSMATVSAVTALVLVIAVSVSVSMSSVSVMLAAVRRSFLARKEVCFSCSIGIALRKSSLPLWWRSLSALAVTITMAVSMSAVSALVVVIAVSSTVRTTGMVVTALWRRVLTFKEVLFKLCISLALGEPSLRWGWSLAALVMVVAVSVSSVTALVTGSVVMIAVSSARSTPSVVMTAMRGSLLTLKEGLLEVCISLALGKSGLGRWWGLTALMLRAVCVCSVTALMMMVAMAGTVCTAMSSAGRTASVVMAAMGSFLTSNEDLIDLCVSLTGSQPSLSMGSSGVAAVAMASVLCVVLGMGAVVLLVISSRMLEPVFMSMLMLVPRLLMLCHGRHGNQQSSGESGGDLHDDKCMCL